MLASPQAMARSQVTETRADHGKISGIWGLVWFFVLFSKVKKNLIFPKFAFQKDVGARLRNQCKEISKVPERKAVR